MTDKPRRLEFEEVVRWACEGVPVGESYAVGMSVTDLTLEWWRTVGHRVYRDRGSEREIRRVCREFVTARLKAALLPGVFSWMWLLWWVVIPVMRRVLDWLLAEQSARYFARYGAGAD